MEWSTAGTKEHQALFGSQTWGLAPLLGLIFKAAPEKQGCRGEAQAARGCRVSGESEDALSESPLFRSPWPLGMPLSSDPSQGPLSACLGAFGLLSFVWSPWVLTLPIQRQTKIGPGPGCPASPAALHTVLCQQNNLRSRALSPTAQEAPPPAWKASAPRQPCPPGSVPPLPTNRAPGILKCSAVALSGCTGSILGWLSLPPPPS